jgi:hypothetical protein
MKNKIFATVLLFISTLAQAGSINSTVNSVRIDRSGKGMVQFSSPITQVASCSTGNYASYFSFNTNTDAGKAIYSMVLAATASGKRVVAYGTGTCLDYGNVVESWNYGHFYKD